MDKQDKIFIVGGANTPIIEIADKLVSLDESLKIASKFTSDRQLKDLTYDNNNQHLYYNDNENIHLDYKNNALLYIFSTEYTSEGVTLDEFYMSDIIPLNIENFNVVSEKVLESASCLIVWIDSKCNSDNHLMKETKFLMERLDKLAYMYFFDEDTDDICNAIMEYISGTPHERKRLLKNYA